MRKLILIIILLISSFSYYGVVDENGEKVTVFENVVNEQNDIEQVQEKNVLVNETQENILEQIENTTAQTETIQNEETPVKEMEKEPIAPIEEKQNKSDSKKKNKETKPKQVTQPKQDSQVKEQKETKENNSNTTEKKEEINNNKNQNKNANNTNNAPKCTHSNSNWYNSKAEAEAIYNAEIKKWGDKWTNYEIDNDTYYRNCPSGYEVFSCPYCNKWTINLYY